MNHTSPSQPHKEQARPRASQSGLTQQQKLILLLAGLLVSAWIVFAAAFLLTRGMIPAEGKPNHPLSPTSLLTAPAATSVGDAPAAAHSISISATCAQHNVSVQEGTVTRVEDSGLLRISSAEGDLSAGLAGIRLLTDGQQGELALQTLREMVESQPVLLVQDVSAQIQTGQLDRYIFTRQQFVNEALVRQGLAKADAESLSQSCAAAFHLAEQKARGEQAGMWKPTPVPTHTFMPFVTLDTSKQPACDCSKRYECSDFTSHDDAQACYNACNDYNSRLDPDRDGIACESLP